MKRLLIAALLATFVTGTTLVSLAADPPAEKAGDANKGKRPAGRPFRGTVKSFDKTSQTLTLEGEKPQTVLITSTTRFYKEGKQATTESLTAGETVMGFGRDNADGKLEALTIRVGKPAPRNVPPAEKGKGEEKKEK
jgi:hypothetical protein